MIKSSRTLLSSHNTWRWEAGGRHRQQGAGPKGKMNDPGVPSFPSRLHRCKQCVHLGSQQAASQAGNGSQEKEAEASAGAFARSQKPHPEAGREHQARDVISATIWGL